MAITNDVSLITFVPFGLTVLRMAGQEHLAVPVAVLQTAAANLGSMLTPMGNPQNLYLYARSGMGFWGLCGLMLPYVCLLYTSGSGRNSGKAPGATDEAASRQASPRGGR